MKNTNSVENLERKLLAQPSAALQWFIHILFIIVIIMIAWAMIFEIDIRVQGQGKTLSEGRVQKVQNLEGGIVSEIMVVDGSPVAKGELLMRFSEVDALSKVKERMSELFGLRVQASRLEAEGQNRKPIFPKAKTREQQKIIDDELALYRESQNSLKTLLEGVDQKIKQEESRFQEIKSRLQGAKKRLALVDDYYQKINTLAKEGVASRAEVDLAKKEVITVKTELTTMRENLHGIRASVDELKSTKEERIYTFRTNMRSKKSDIDIRITNLESGVESFVDDLERREVRTPINGVIKTLHVNTIGQVVKPGDIIAEIIPVKRTIEVEAKIDPKDIAHIHVGQNAMVRLTAFDFSIYGGIKGRVKKIWPDSIETDRGQVYYRISVELERNYVAGGNQQTLSILPGMVATVDILTGRRTVMEYLLKPIKRGLYVSFTER